MMSHWQKKEKGGFWDSGVLFLVGPTAVGKTAVGVELALRLNGEIVSADSMQLYRGLDLLSAAPGEVERAKVPHHLIGILGPKENCDVARYRQMAVPVIENILSRDRLPVVVGGSGMYVKALVDGIFEGPGRDPALRRRLEAEAEERGSGHLHWRLRRVDPRAAEKIHPHDVRRIIRALEVFEKTGTPLSELQKEWSGEPAPSGAGAFISRNLGRPAVILGLRRPKREIKERINRRVDLMFREGAVEEVRRLPAGPGCGTVRQSLGLDEIRGYLEGHRSREEAKELLKRNTRAYAKRQMTWFGGDPRVVWYDLPEGKGADLTAERVTVLIKEISDGK